MTGKQNIISLLKIGPCTSAQLSNDLGLSKKMVWYWMSCLKDLGIVYRKRRRGLPPIWYLSSKTYFEKKPKGLVILNSCPKEPFSPNESDYGKVDHRYDYLTVRQEAGSNYKPGQPENALPIGRID